jgi:hydrogenase maturation protein HypF
MIFTWHIHIQGQVQGVGFRPYVFSTAQKFHLSGWVKNAGDGVHIEFNGDPDLAEKFYKSIISDPPANAYITSHTLVKTISESYSLYLALDMYMPGKDHRLYN